MAHLKKNQRATSNNLKKMDKDEYTIVLCAPLTILQHFGNFNLFAMSDNIHTGYHIAIPDDIWREDINSIGSKH